MKITEIAIRESRFTASLILFLVVGGTIAFLNLPRSEDPKIPFRYALITTIFPGASAERMEETITQRIEEVIKEVPEVEFSTSLTRNSASGVLVKLKDQYDSLEPVWDQIRRKLSRLEGDFPEGVQGPDLNDEYGEVFGIIVTVAGEALDYPELKRHTDQLRQNLLALGNVSKVEILGERSERVFVRYDDADMADAGISPLVLKSYLEAQNFIAPGGAIIESGTRVAVEPASELRTAKDLENLHVAMPGEDDTYALYELLEVHAGQKDPPDSMLRSSGLPSLGLAISMRKGGDIAELGREVRATLDRFRSEAPATVIVETVAFEPDRVKSRVNGFFVNLLQSLIIVAVILIAALGLRTGSAVAAMMPIVILSALVVLYWLHLDINLVSLAAFIVVLGIMVDNHIVISERILTLREAGMKPYEAAIASTRELSAPLITATVITASGFMPIYLAESTSGEYVSPLFSIITITLCCSTFLAFTATPALSILVFRNTAESATPRLDHWSYRAYRSVLTGVLNHPGLSIGTAMLLFCLAIFSFRYVPTTFFPPSDRPMFTAQFMLPSGTPIETTAALAGKLDTFVAENLGPKTGGTEGIVNWVTFIGRNAPRFILNHRTREYTPEYAYFLFNVNSAAIYPEVKRKLEAYARESLPELSLRINRLEAGPAVGYPIRVHVSGSDITRIREIAAEIKEFLHEIPGIQSLNDDWGEPVKKHRLIIDEEASGAAGVTHAEIAVAMQTNLTGIPVTALQEGAAIRPVFIQSSSSNGESELERILGLRVFSRMRETTVLLRDVAGFVEVREPANIMHRDFQRTISVQADLAEKVNAKRVDDRIDEFIERNADRWGSAYNVRTGGESAESKKANRSIVEKLPWSAFVILLLLIRQTRSLRRTLVVASTVPMAIIGVAAGLLITRLEFGFTVLVGMVSLVGIVVNNAIILLDRIRLNSARGDLDGRECITEAAVDRFRPILLTTVTTVGGVLPLYLSGNPTWQGIAVPIMFGLMFSTVFVLVVLPVICAVLFREPQGDASTTP